MGIQQIIGALGEDIAVKHLNNKGYSIIERNYWKKWGEIDVIAEKSGILHFVEVKSVSHVTPAGAVTHVTPGFDPQDHMNADKKHRLGKVIQTYITAKNVKGDWQVDLLLVYLDKTTKTARIDFIENITLLS
jgi:putative endonuclease